MLEQGVTPWREKDQDKDLPRDSVGTSFLWESRRKRGGGQTLRKDESESEDGGFNGGYRRRGDVDIRKAVNHS